MKKVIWILPAVQEVLLLGKAMQKFGMGSVIIKEQL